MITLGIPGSPTAAVMLGGLMIWGLQPGPMLFKDHPDFVWGLIASIWASNALGVLIVLAFVPLFVAILRTPFSILMPSIVFPLRHRRVRGQQPYGGHLVRDPFRLVGYVFKKLEYPLAPMVLALVLGDLAESAMRQSLIMSQGSLLDLLRKSPIAAVVNGLATLFFLWPAVKAIRSWLHREPTDTDSRSCRTCRAADR